MRQIAIFHERINDYAQGPVYVDPAAIQAFSINNIPLTTGVLATLDETFDPDAPEHRDRVLVRKLGFSCNYRDKALALKAKFRIDDFAAQQQAKYFSLGSEFVGDVVAVGRDVQTLVAGDRVIGNGSYPYSGYDHVKPGLPTNRGSRELETFHFAKLVRVPATMPLEVAASFPIGAQTTYSMIRKLELKPGEKVLVTAATSNTSLFAIQALRNYPVRVFVVSTRADFNEQLLDMGVEQVFVVGSGQDSLAANREVFDFVRQHGGFDAVIDPFFDLYLGRVIDVMGLESRYTTCGMYAQPYVGDETQLRQLPQNYEHVMSTVMMKNIRLIGNCIGRTEDLEHAIEDYSQGKLEVVIDSVFRGNDVAPFFERSFNARDRFGKVVYLFA